MSPRELPSPFFFFLFQAGSYRLFPPLIGRPQRETEMFEHRLGSFPPPFPLQRRTSRSLPLPPRHRVPMENRRIPRRIRPSLLLLSFFFSNPHCQGVVKDERLPPPFVSKAIDVPQRPFSPLFFHSGTTQQAPAVLPFFQPLVRSPSWLHVLPSFPSPFGNQAVKI